MSNKIKDDNVNTKQISFLFYNFQLRFFLYLKVDFLLK